MKPKVNTNKNFLNLQPEKQTFFLVKIYGSDSTKYKNCFYLNLWTFFSVAALFSQSNSNRQNGYLYK